MRSGHSSKFIPFEIRKSTIVFVFVIVLLYTSFRRISVRLQLTGDSLSKESSTVGTTPLRGIDYTSNLREKELEFHRKGVDDVLETPSFKETNVQENVIEDSLLKERLKVGASSLRKEYSVISQEKNMEFSNEEGTNNDSLLKESSKVRAISSGEEDNGILQENNIDLINEKGTSDVSEMQSFQRIGVQEQTEDSPLKGNSEAGTTSLKREDNVILQEKNVEFINEKGTADVSEMLSVEAEEVHAKLSSLENFVGNYSDSTLSYHSDVTQLNVQEFRDEREPLQSLKPAITRAWDVCPDNYPPQHAILHERRQDLKEYYEKDVGGRTSLYNGVHLGLLPSDMLELKTLKDGKFALYAEREQEHSWAGQGSAWNDSEVALTIGLTSESGKPLGTLVEPLDWITYRQLIQVHGDYVAYTGWMYGNLGHFMHDNLPNIAYLKYLLPNATGFILGYDELHARILEFIDPVFSKKIRWIDRHHHIFQVDGELTVTTTNQPHYVGCCDYFDPLRQWMAEAHPEVPAKKVVIFYTRGNKETGESSADNYHGRVLNPQKEKWCLNLINQKLKQYNRTEEVVVFDGMEKGITMSIENQFKLFRSASTIIGPHGSGLGGNFIWTNPFARSCDDRVQVLEFIPGKESAHVQTLHASYFMQYRKWPLEYHQILYTNESTPMVTDINIDNFNDALDAMWGPNRIKTVDPESSAWQPASGMSAYLEYLQKKKELNKDPRLNFDYFE